MGRNLRACVVFIALLVGMSWAADPAVAHWRYPWGHHFGRGWGHGGYYGGYYGGYGSWAYPGFSYTSISIGLPRYRAYSAYSVGAGYYGYCAPRVSYSVGWPAYYCASPVVYSSPVLYSSCYPSVYYSPSYYVSSYSTPGYYAPVTGWPTCVSTTPASAMAVSTASLTAATPRPHLVDQLLAAKSSTAVDNALASVRFRLPVDRASPSGLDRDTAPISDVRRSVRTVSTAQPMPVSIASSTSTIQRAEGLTPVPPVLMEAADKIFAAGGFAEAAAAYARLAVRYGNHDELTVRRFVALIASGDHSQATVVYQLAKMNDQPMRASTLPAGSLSGLYRVQSSARKEHIDWLADYALQSGDDPLPLAMVGTWLELDGQVARAEAFFRRAAMLSHRPQTEASPNRTQYLAAGSPAR